MPRSYTATAVGAGMRKADGDEAGLPIKVMPMVNIYQKTLPSPPFLQGLGWVDHSPSRRMRRRRLKIIAVVVVAREKNGYHCPFRTRAPERLFRQLATAIP